MNATKNELQHNTMLHYYIGTTVNGAKGIAHTVKANPLWIVAMLVMAWLAYSVQDMRATESMGSIGHLMTVLQSVEMLAVAAIALVVVCYRIGSVTGAKQMYQDLLRGGIVNSAGEAPLLVERKRMQRLIERLHDRRDWLAEHDCRNIDDYNERYPDNKLRRVMLLIDEAAIALDTRTQNKAKKAARQEIVEAINELACTGRFVGFSFLISLQRPSAEVLSGELRNNLTIRLVGKSDANLSMLALDNADAAKLIPSDTPGRFLTSNGEILQGYYFEDTMLRNLPDKKSPAWEFLMNGENLYHQMTMQELEEKNKTKGEDKNEQ